MALIDDVTSLLQSAESAIASGDDAAALVYARRAQALAPMLPNVIQQGGDRIERQQIIAGIKAIIDQAAPAAASSSSGGSLAFAKITHKEPSCP